MTCYVVDYPPGCSDDQWCWTDLIEFIYLYIPWLFVLVMLPLANIVVFLFVRRILRQGENNERTLYQKQQLKEVATQGTCTQLLFCLYERLRAHLPSSRIPLCFFFYPELLPDRGAGSIRYDELRKEGRIKSIPSSDPECNFGANARRFQCGHLLAT